MGALTVAAALGTLPILLWRTPPPQRPGAPLTLLPQQRTLSTMVTTSGTVRLASGAQVRVGSQVSGVVVRLNVTVGSHIRRGEVIAQIDPRPLAARVAQARAQALIDEVALEKARRDEARLSRLAQARLVPAQQMEDLTWQVKSAAARLARSQSDLAAAQVDLSYTVVRAPITGTVASVSTQEGETVAAALNAPTFVTIIADGALELVAMVDETDIAGVKPGEAMRFAVEAYPALELTARVRRIDPTATILSGVVNYPVIGALEGDVGMLRPDMTADITIETGSRGALFIPAAATGRRGADVMVYLAPQRAQETPVARRVRLGERRGEVVEVIAGLAAGERILARAPDGGAVRP